MQFSLFEESRASAQIVAFPLVRRRGLIRETARSLAVLSYEDGRRYWTRHLREIRKEMKATGITASAIQDEIRRYEVAVGHQTMILTSYRHSQPDDAA